MSRILTDPAPVDHGRAMMFENGGPFVVVTGDCRYWVLVETWDGVRVGSLTESTLRDLNADLHVGSWDELGGYYRPLAGTAHYPDSVFKFGDAVVICGGDCDDASVTPSEVLEMRDQLRAWADRLYASGAPAGGPVRAMAYAPYMLCPGGVCPESVPFQPWSLALPLEDITIDATTSVDVGLGFLVDGPNADALRDLRRRHVAGEFGRPFSNYYYLPVLHDGTAYSVYVRDATPFEDARGLIQAFHAPGL